METRDRILEYPACSPRICDHEPEHVHHYGQYNRHDGHDPRG